MFFFPCKALRPDGFLDPLLDVFVLVATDQVSDPRSGRLCHKFALHLETFPLAFGLVCFLHWCHRTDPKL